MFYMPFLVLDLEMSGPDFEWHDIIQIGAVLYDDQWNWKGEHLTNVFPENDEGFSSRAEGVHGLTLAELDEAPMMYEVLPEMEDWIREKLGRKRPNKRVSLQDVVIMGQSVINDINFLQVAYKREKLKWPYSRKLVDLHTTAFLISRILEKNNQPAPKKLSLEAIAQYFGLSRTEESHNALEDAQLTAQCFEEIFKLMDRLQLSPAETR
jgi:DNA polymerase-3 subunit epsilon